MEYLVEFFKFIGESQGFSTMWVVIVATALGAFLVFIIRTFSNTIKKYFEDRDKVGKKEHAKKIEERKKFSKEVRKILGDLAKDTNADRSLLFEYSNSSSNLIGLPFLYATATAEVLSPGVSSVCGLYQKINTAMIADFLIHIESQGYYYVQDIEELKDKYPVVYNFMKPNNVKSGMFYIVQGVNEVIGFIVITTVNDREIIKREALNKISKAAQKISSMLNFDELGKGLSKKKKMLW